MEVFDRKPDYDPRVDPIVRVEARRLRSKLEEFYAGNGKDSQVNIDLPKGRICPHIPASAARPSPQEEPKRERTRSVAVLPIVNTSRETEHDYLCEGITQEIIHALTKAMGLRVVAWQSAAASPRKTSTCTPSAVNLECPTSCAGTLRVASGRLRLLTQLIDTSNGEYVWSESYDRRIADVLDIEQEISAAIVRALQMQIGVSRRPTANH